MDTISNVEDSNQRLIKQQEFAESEIEKHKKQAERVLKISWGLVACGVVIAVVGFFLFDVGQNQQYAEFFGGIVGPIWGLASILLIYVAFIGQKQQLIQQQLEIQYNQLELRATREELKGQRLQLEEQNNEAKFQRFENNFFRLLSTFNTIVREICVNEIKAVPKGLRGFPGPNTPTDSVLIEFRGKKALSKLFHELVKAYERTENKFDPPSERSRIASAYSKIFDSWEGNLMQYMSNVVLLLEYVDEAGVTEKELYIKTLKAQLSVEELVLILSHFISVPDREVETLFKKYALFASIMPVNLLNPAHFDTFLPLFHDF